MDAFRSGRLQTATLLAVVVLGFAGVATASSQEDLPVDIEYRAQGSSCPSRDEFVVAVREALAVSDARLARDERQFTVTLEDGRGILEVWTEGGRSTSHEVRGSSCSEVGSALALSLALAIAPPEISPADSPPQDTAPKPTAPARIESGPPQYAVGLAALGMIGPTPLALGGMLFFDLPHGKGQLIAPHVRVGAALLGTVTPYEVSFQSPAASVSAVRLNWQWYLLRAEFCGLHIAAATDSSGLRLCAAMDAGYIVSQPSGLLNAKSSGNPWLAPGLGMRAFAEMLGVLFELSTGLSLPLTRYRYFLDAYGTLAATDVHQIQPIGWTFSLGASYRFP